jgi:hypothetical protein
LTGFSRQQLLYRVLRCLVVEQYVRNRIDDRHGDAVLMRELLNRLHTANTFGDMTQLSDDHIQRLASRKTETDLPVTRQITGAGEYQVAHAGETHEGFAATTEGGA